MMNHKNRLRRLERPAIDPGDCPGGITVIVDEGEPVPPDALPCRLCGEPHVGRIVKEIVEARRLGPTPILPEGDK